MPNTYVNKVVKSDGTTLIDLTSDTVTSAAHIVSGRIGHLADGSQVTGTATVGVDVAVYTVVWDDNWESPISVSCNKGYYDITFGDAVMVRMTNQSHTEGGYASAVSSAVGSDYYVYTVISGFMPYMDIRHNNNNTVVVTMPSSHVETLNVSQNGTYYPESGVIQEVNVNVPATVPTLQSKSVSYTPSETAKSATVTADNGYDGLSSVAVSVGAISSSYVGSGIDRRSSSDLTASGATVTVPSGYYASQATKSVASGTEGTPTATKSSVNNHSVSVTPSVTNAAGYISGGTKTGTAITVSASELVSGSETKTANGTYDVTNLASIVIDVPSSGGSTLGTKTITENGTFSASADGYDGYSSVTVNVPTGGGNIGGLSEMVDVNSYDNSWGYFLMCLKKGNTVGGKVTYTSAFPNTETKILETGLTTLHGIMFSRYDVNIGTNVSGQPNKTIFIFLNSAGTISAVGMYANNAVRIYGQAQGTVYNGVPLNGAVRFNGGDVYYTGRYNKNANYQMLNTNIEYEWLAW